jgi:hypothetical protein
MLCHWIKSKMDDVGFEIGEIVTIEPWDCEGVEMPWGLDGKKEDIKLSKTMLKYKKIKIPPSTVGMIISYHMDESPNMVDKIYHIMTQGRVLRVPCRFVNKTRR